MNRNQLGRRLCVTYREWAISMETRELMPSWEATQASPCGQKTEGQGANGDTKGRPQARLSRHPLPSV